MLGVFEEATITHIHVPKASDRRMQLGRAEALRLLASVPFGRIVYSHQALPAIRLVNHLVDNGRVLIRTQHTAAVVPAALDEVVVAYEADQVDQTQRVGWSVIVTGTARLVTDPDQLARYERELHPWVGDDMDHLIVIDPTIVTGIRLLPGPQPVEEAASG